MTGNDGFDNDDYVAKLLAEDAKKSSLRYASAGLSALLPGRSARPGPKPNTRFLSHLVRDVDSHNSALKRKEELEARTRIEGFRKKEREDERQRALNLAHNRRHRDHDDDRRLSDRSSKRRRRSASPVQDRPRHIDDTRKRRRMDQSSQTLGGQEKTFSGQSMSNGYERENNRTYKASRGNKSPKDPSDISKGRRDGNNSRPSKSHPDFSQKRSSLSASDSDPLEAIVGPLPPETADDQPIRVRGRGAQRPFKSNIDSHFSSKYDPSLDIQDDFDPDTDRSDWDMALEALRDRTMWKKKQSERLREAGFNDEEIEKWEKSAIGTDSTDKDVRDVKWKKAGEGREWDIGKPALQGDDEEEDGSQLKPLDKRKSPNGREKTSSQDGWKRKDSGLLKNFRSALGA